LLSESHLALNGLAKSGRNVAYILKMLDSAMKTTKIYALTRLLMNLMRFFIVALSLAILVAYTFVI